jgi:hypothetical protein
MNELNENIWSPEVMALAIAAKKKARSEKNEVFNCFVLDREAWEDELLKFISYLKDSLTSLPDKTRLQLAVRQGVHWTAFDIQVVDGNLNIFCLDAIGNSSAEDATYEFLKNFPQAKIYFYKSDLFFDIIRYEFRQRAIQYDNFSCSRFTLDHLFHLSRIDLFTIFEKQNLEKIGPISVVSTENLTGPLASIFRNTQSWAVLNSLPSEMQNQVINKKGQPLLESARAHSKMIGGKLLNQSIEYKKGVFIKKITQFASKLSPLEIKNIQEKRQGFDYLKQELLVKKIKLLLGEFKTNIDALNGDIKDSFSSLLASIENDPKKDNEAYLAVITAFNGLAQRLQKGPLSKEEIGIFSETLNNSLYGKPPLSKSRIGTVSGNLFGFFSGKKQHQRFVTLKQAVDEIISNSQPKITAILQQLERGDEANRHHCEQTDVIASAPTPSR